MGERREPPRSPEPARGFSLIWRGRRHWRAPSRHCRRQTRRTLTLMTPFFKKTTTTTKEPSVPQPHNQASRCNRSFPSARNASENKQGLEKTHSIFFSVPCGATSSQRSRGFICVLPKRSDDKISVPPQFYVRRSCVQRLSSAKSPSETSRRGRHHGSVTVCSEGTTDRTNVNGSTPLLRLFLSLP